MGHLVQPGVDEFVARALEGEELTVQSYEPLPGRNLPSLARHAAAKVPADLNVIEHSTAFPADQLVAGIEHRAREPCADRSRAGSRGEGPSQEPVRLRRHRDPL